ncbi:MAG: glycosyltransferase [Bacteroidota bacterium]|jgi:cellulose synthase/poly-beta-1,6-N-acetylglucosamine synthase-like glycosyltransferase
MIEIITLVVLSLSSVYYVYFITRVRIGLLSLRFAQPKNIAHRISVVVAARNEEKDIEKCLQSLLKQTYPTNSYEIIIVDDGSTDKTASIVKSFSEHYANIHLLSLMFDSEQKIGRKPIALAKGIAQATGEIILTTDADCLVPSQWIEIMVNHFEEGVVFVAGPVAERDSSTFFAKMEQLEFLGLITTAAGLIGSGRPIICNGANLAYRKDAFTAIDGFNEKSSSNDDESLMNKMVHRKIGKVVFAPEADGVVTTNSSNTVSTFFRQRIRWANKRGHYEDKSILFTLVGLYIFFASMLLTMVLLFREPQLIQLFTVAFGGKILVDYFTLRSGARLFRQRIPIFHFLIAEFLHVPYIVIAAAIGQVASMQWKGRTLRR